MMDFILLAAVFFLAFSNGANDNFKGVATLRQSRYYSFGRAVTWAAVWTALGSVAGIWFAAKLLPIFSGAGLIHSGIDAESFLVAVGGGAALTVFVAVKIGMPISTTHALAGALTGTALLAGGWSNFHPGVLGMTVFLPLLLTPLAAMGLTWSTFPLLRRIFSVTRTCICVTPAQMSPALVGAETLAMPSQPTPGDLLPSITIDTAAACAVHSPGAKWRTDVNEVLHWFSGGLISFSRGMNDTPKIAALLLLPALGVATGTAFAGVAVAMLLGGTLAVRRVAKTVSEDVTDIQPVEGTGANLVTAALVTLASPLGLAVSTTHTAVGSIFGVGLSQPDRTNGRKVREILLAWLFTLPMGGLLGSALYFLFQ